MSKKIAVYCGSRMGNDPCYRAAAETLGTSIGSKGYTLVFGGGKIGLMGVVADAVMAAGGKAHGVIPKFLVDKEQAHRGLDELEIVSTMHERKARMIAQSDHFVALPGGVGTFEEIFEVLSWRHLGLITGSIALLNVNGCYDGATRLFQDTLAAGFLPTEESDILHVCASVEEIMRLWG